MDRFQIGALVTAGTLLTVLIYIAIQSSQLQKQAQLRTTNMGAADSALAQLYSTFHAERTKEDEELARKTESSITTAISTNATEYSTKMDVFRKDQVDLIKDALGKVDATASDLDAKAVAWDSEPVDPLSATNFATGDRLSLAALSTVVPNMQAQVTTAMRASVQAYQQLGDQIAKQAQNIAIALKATSKVDSNYYSLLARYDGFDMTTKPTLRGDLITSRTPFDVQNEAAGHTILLTANIELEKLNKTVGSIDDSKGHIDREAPIRAVLTQIDSFFKHESAKNLAKRFGRELAFRILSISDGRPKAVEKLLLSHAKSFLDESIFQTDFASVSSIFTNTALNYPLQLKNIWGMWRSYRAWLAYPHEVVLQYNNWLLVGPPGTGKTSIADAIYRLTRSMGLCLGKYRKIVGSDLIGTTDRESALLVEEAMLDTVGGILFIDEAYTLCSGSDSSSQQLAAAHALTYWLEELRGVSVVMLAGYEADIARLTRCNPGLVRRFPRVSICEPLFRDAPPRYILFWEAFAAELYRIVGGHPVADQHTWVASVNQTPDIFKLQTYKVADLARVNYGLINILLAEYLKNVPSSESGATGNKVNETAMKAAIKQAGPLMDLLASSDVLATASKVQERTRAEIQSLPMTVVPDVSKVEVDKLAEMLLKF